MPKFYYRMIVSLKCGLGLFVLAGVMVFVVPVRCVCAGTLVLRVYAGIPLGSTTEGPQEVYVRADLPPRVGTNDIVDLGGLELGYDYRTDSYFVHKTITLDSSDPDLRSTAFNVEINDIWVISREEILELTKRADALVGQLEGTDYYETAEATRQRIASDLAAIEESQDSHSIQRGVEPKEHILAYESDLEQLKRVKNYIGHIENLVLGTGQDPGTLIGNVQGAAAPIRDIEFPEDGYGTATIRITVHNPSSRETRKPRRLRRDLPPEITLEDVIDPAGLDVKKDPKTGICYVLTKDDIELEPLETRTFDVKIRDKWNVNRPRIVLLKAKAEDVLVKVGSRMKFASVEELLRGLIVELEQIEQEVGPEELNDRYLAFYREQAQRIDLVEVRINRVEAALKPMTQTSKFGFEVKAPSSRTTWAIIYIILGFLALMSVLFFLRWYARTKAEALSGEASQVKKG